jgi:hypothetical protein
MLWRYIDVFDYDKDKAPSLLTSQEVEEIYDLLWGRKKVLTEYQEAALKNLDKINLILDGIINKK